jgi:hypothetical protein
MAAGERRADLLSALDKFNLNQQTSLQLSHIVHCMHRKVSGMCASDRRADACYALDNFDYDLMASYYAGRNRGTMQGEAGESVGDAGDGVDDRAAGRNATGNKDNPQSDKGESVGDAGESVGEAGENVGEAGDSVENLDGGEGSREWEEEGDSGALGMRGSTSSMCRWLVWESA